LLSRVKLEPFSIFCFLSHDPASPLQLAASRVNRSMLRDHQRGRSPQSEHLAGDKVATFFSRFARSLCCKVYYTAGPIVTADRDARMRDASDTFALWPARTKRTGRSAGTRRVLPREMAKQIRHNVALGDISLQHVSLGRYLLECTPPHSRRPF